MNQNYLAMALMSMLCLLFSGCSKSIEKEIIGRWENTVEKDRFGGYVEFFSDNKVKLKIGAKDFIGTWTKLEGNRIRITTEETISVLDDVEISGDRLKCSVNDGPTLEFERTR